MLKNQSKVENALNWNPGYWKPKGVFEIFVAYEKKWFCNENKVIHQNIKDYINCTNCCSDSDRVEYTNLLKFKN